ncbi:hypothetical protein Ppha_0454 [Pelodictyon phaeoclathratiforme BU-1]|jgi:hypothetical protein|uniref:Uncharacterized protein n=1 Tax=Pelodictyon phaeoclathratiforme (strain DSM 5477 / BU-1) TaxID=324925 RepID=B4SCU6_PELPB|nr:hypothetical protein Ppha_0454 [Pelodictyon phaeoclathratiforme BU-1]
MVLCHGCAHVRFLLTLFDNCYYEVKVQKMQTLEYLHLLYPLYNNEGNNALRVRIAFVQKTLAERLGVCEVLGSKCQGKLLLWSIRTQLNFEAFFWGESGESGLMTEKLSWLKSMQRKSGGCEGKDCVLTWGDLALCLKGRRSNVGQEVSRGHNSPML